MAGDIYRNIETCEEVEPLLDIIQDNARLARMVLNGCTTWTGPTEAFDARCTQRAMARLVDLVEAGVR